MSESNEKKYDKELLKAYEKYQKEKQSLLINSIEYRNLFETKFDNISSVKMSFFDESSTLDYTEENFAFNISARIIKRYCFGDKRIAVMMYSDYFDVQISKTSKSIPKILTFKYAENSPDDVVKEVTPYLKD